MEMYSLTDNEQKWFVLILLAGSIQFSILALSIAMPFINISIALGRGLL
jgi:hypothetical protein